jgi:hypothetical protein
VTHELASLYPKQRRLHEKENFMEERLDALEIALKNEMNEHHFYLKNAERTVNPVGKAMFTQIAAEELEHYERLKQLADNWKRDKKWPETLPLKVNDTAVRSIFGRAAQGGGGNGRGRRRSESRPHGDRVRGQGRPVLCRASGPVGRSEGEGLLRASGRYRA